MKENHSAFDNFMSARTTLQRVGLAYSSFGVSEVLYNRKKIVEATKNVVASKRNKRIAVASASLITFVCVGSFFESREKPAIAASSPAPVYTRWNNPNVKPFEVSPWFQGGYTPTVYWDAQDKQWRCKINEDTAVPCRQAEGKTEEQFAQDRYNSEKYMADRDARERALNDYWCGPFEDPKKTGCNKL